MSVSNETIWNPSGFNFSSERGKCVDESNAQIRTRSSQTWSEFARLRKRDGRIGVTNESVEHSMTIRQVHDPRPHAIGTYSAAPCLKRRLIVGRILGEAHAGIATKLIGLREVLLGVWAF